MALIDGQHQPRTAGEWFAVLQDLIEEEAAELQMDPPTYSRKEALTILLRLVAQLQGEIDQIPVSVADSLDPNQISGELLNRFASFARVTITPGQNSTVPLTVGAAGASAVVLEEGAQAFDGAHIWETIDDVTIPAGGTAVVSAVCLTDGAVLADAGTIVQRRSSTPGWTSVTNVVAATPGFEGDPEAVTRAKISNGAGSAGSLSPFAIQYALEQIPGVRRARVVFNRTWAAVTVAGRTVPQSGVGVWVFPSTISDDSKRSCASVLFGMLSASTARSLPSGTGADGVLASFASEYGEQSFDEGFWWMEGTRIFARVEILSTTTGYSVDSLTPLVRSAVLDYFAALLPGQGIEQQEIQAATTTIPGVRRVLVEIGLSSGSLAEDDIDLDAATFAELASEDLEVL